MYWCSEEYDRLHGEGMVEVDAEKRTEIYIRMQELMDEAAHSVWISYPSQYFVTKAGLEPSILPSGDYIPWRFKSE